MYWRGRSFDRVHYPETPRNQMIEWNYRSEIFAFSRRLNENLSEDTLRQVFAHQSYVQNLRQNQIKFNLPEQNIKSNAEMVHRGSKLLDKCLKPYLRYTFNKVPEDGIDHIARYLGSDEVLSDVAIWIGCKDIILSGEYPPGQTTMADTVRALLAGIESDLDINRVRRFVVDIIFSYLNDRDILDDVWVLPNPQETLNFILANSKLPAYEPRIMFQTGINTLEPCHIIGLYTNQKLLGSSAGETLKIAEHCAAIDSLQRLFDLKEDRAPYVYGEASEKINYDAHEAEHEYVKTWSIRQV